MILTIVGSTRDTRHPPGGRVTGFNNIGKKKFFIEMNYVLFGNRILEKLKPNIDKIIYYSFVLYLEYF